jgi:hypothetical protein
MRISHIAFILGILSAPCAGYALQAATGSAQNSPTTTAAAPKPNAGQVTPSGLLQPSLDTLQQTLGSVKVEKWKGGSIRAEAAPNISSIQRDLESTLPSLIKDADAAPGTMSKVMPVSRNVDALYDVLLRVVDGARVAAPVDQVSQLQDAMVGLEKARKATAQEKQVNDLQVAMKSQAAPVCPVAPAPVCPAVTPPKKRVAKKKPAQPATGQPANPQPSATKPNP